MGNGMFGSGFIGILGFTEFVLSPRCSTGLNGTAWLDED